MREAVEQILANTYDYEKGSLSFSCTELEIEILCGEVYEGRFQIFSEEGRYTKGYVSSTDLRMECLIKEFVGKEETVAFRFHGDQLEEGDVVNGCFQIVSNQGEYTIPYVVTVAYSVPQSSMGPIDNLFHFADLARSNWKEAVKLFYSPDFEKMIRNCESKSYLLYRGLSAREGNEQNVEEFLNAVNKKQRIEFLVSEEQVILDDPVGMAELEITILRNGWGYTHLDVYTEGDFLFVEKSTITEDDFLGNSCRLPVYVDSAYLHAGKNWGTIKLEGIYGVLQVSVCINVGRRNAAERAKRRKQEKGILELMELYQNYRLKKVSSSIWKKETGKVLDTMSEDADEDVSIGLFRVQLLITEERYNEAEELLQQIHILYKEGLPPATEAYFLYLNALLHEDEAYVAEIEEQVLKIYYEQGEEWRVAWLLLFLSGNYNRNILEKWHFLEKQFQNGCRSPLIYAEAIQLLNVNPTLLRKLGDFELQAVHYGNKQDVVSAELQEQIIYLSGRVKEYSPILSTVLKDFYSKRPDSRILQEICTQLIKGNKTDKSCYEWFAKGVDEELRITNLYEYYMLSVDLEKEPQIPKRVLLYNTYQNNLDYLHSAYLYYYVTVHKEQMPEIFEAYSKRIEWFVTEQIGKLHFNSHLAYLYNIFLREDMIDPTVAEALSYLSFAHEIRLQKERIRNVIVCQPENKGELIYPVMNETVWIPLYGEECILFFEDLQGNRFAKDFPCSVAESAVSKQFMEAAALLSEQNPAMDIYLCRKEQETVPDEAGLKRWFRVLKNPGAAKTLKAKISIQIAQYYVQIGDKEHLTQFLEQLPMKLFSGKESGEIIRFLVLNGQVETAYAWLKQFREEHVDYKILLALLTETIEKGAYAYERELVDFCYHMFTKGCQNSILLTYLMKYYQGSTGDLVRLWNSAKTYSMEKKAFCERVLVQLLFTGETVEPGTEIFKEYVYSGADKRIEEAYLIKNCYAFLVEEKQLPQEIIIEIGRLHSVGEPVSTECQLAFLKYYGDKTWEITESDAGIVSDFLGNMLKAGIRLQYFGKLKPYCPSPMLLLDKTIVEYHAQQDCTVKIHYRIIGENGTEQEAEYRTALMESVLGRIFYKEFVLFFGETLQYYFTEEAEGRKKVTESIICHRENEQDAVGDGRFGMINAMARNRLIGDQEAFELAAQEYYRKDFLNRAFFD